ncbi:hypothetical protein [Stackebrandtia soli]|uniref:hypothetical protein n=1 Tax=Stackebrandtia soli TaxID=1892856 RepID=UPI0039EA3AB2
MNADNHEANPGPERLLIRRLSVAEPIPGPVSAPAPQPRAGTDSNAVDGSSAGRDINQTTQTASRDVHNHNYFGSKPTEPNRLRADWRNREALAAEAETTVPPADTDALVSVLARERLIVLSSRPKSGQRTTARYLVHHLIETGQAPSSLRAARVILESNEIKLGDAVAAHTDTALIVDLTEEDRNVVTGVCGELGIIFPALVDADSYLVVLIQPASVVEFAKAVPGALRELVGPEGEQVFRRHTMGRLDPSIVDYVLADDVMAERFREARPPRAARLARSAISLSTDSPSVSALVAALRDVSDDWRVQLDEEIGARPDALRRCLYLGAAVYQGCEPGVITAAADALHELAKLDTEPVHPLLQESPYIRLKPLRSSGFDPGSGEFNRPGYATALLPYVWQTFPRLRKLLLHWWIRLVDQTDFYDLDTTVDAFIGLCVREPDTVTDLGNPLVRTFAAEEGPPSHIRDRRRDAAVRFLGRAAIHDALGRRVRRLLWQWAHDGNVDRQYVVAKICAGEFGQRYPHNALTRLKHLMRGDEVKVRAAAAEALRSIADRIGFAELAAVMSTWAKGDARAPERAKDALARLAMEPESIADLVKLQNGRLLWRQLIDVLDIDVQGVVGAVLLAAGDSGGEQQRLIVNLAGSIGDSQRRYDVLCHALKQCLSAVPSPVERERLTRALTAIRECGPPVLRHPGQEVSA